MDRKARETAPAAATEEAAVPTAAAPLSTPPVTTRPANSAPEIRPAQKSLADEVASMAPPMTAPATPARPAAEPKARAAGICPSALPTTRAVSAEEMPLKLMRLAAWPPASV